MATPSAHRPLSSPRRRAPLLGRSSTRSATRYGKGPSRPSALPGRVQGPRRRPQRQPVVEPARHRPEGDRLMSDRPAASRVSSATANRQRLDRPRTHHSTTRTQGRLRSTVRSARMSTGRRGLAETLAENGAPSIKHDHRGRGQSDEAAPSNSWRRTRAAPWGSSRVPSTTGARPRSALRRPDRARVSPTAESLLLRAAPPARGLTLRRLYRHTACATRG